MSDAFFFKMSGDLLKVIKYVWWGEKKFVNTVFMIFRWYLCNML